MTINRGDRVIKFHIPSCGPFPRELRMDSYRRAYADWLADGHPTGWGFGVILFDGEKILNNDRD